MEKRIIRSSIAGILLLFAATIIACSEVAAGLTLAVVFGMCLHTAWFKWTPPYDVVTRAARPLVVAGGIAYLTFRLDRIVEPFHSTKLVAQALLKVAGPDDLIFHEGSLEYSGGLPFYSGMQVNVVNGKRGSLEFGSRFPKDNGRFINRDEFEHVWDGDHKAFLVTGPYVARSVAEGWRNPARFLVGKYGTRLLYTNKPETNSKSQIVNGE